MMWNCVETDPFKKGKAYILLVQNIRAMILRHTFLRQKIMEKHGQKLPMALVPCTLPGV